MRWILATLFLFFPPLSSAAIWQDAETPELAAKGIDLSSIYYRKLIADSSALRQRLLQAPLQESSSSAIQLELPLPYGSMQRFLVEESPVMAESLARRYPEIRTYRVRGVDNPASSGRLDLTPAGFHAMLTTPAGSVFIDPDGDGGYRSYYKRDYAAAQSGQSSPLVCMHRDGQAHVLQRAAFVSPTLASRTVSGSQRRIYRLAVAATGEYSAYFGGTVSSALAQIVTTINRVNQVYGRDLAVQFQLVGNNDRIIFTDPDADPYTQTAAGISLMLIENQETLDFILGVDNYDIGILFGTVGGGLASVGSSCTVYKAQAYTGTPTPDNDGFYIDFVAHELGHQLNASHSFNGTTASCGGVNRVATTAMEPGSGSTIMSYAGICEAEDLQANSDATFHAISIQQMNEFITQGEGNQCGQLTITGNNAPSVDAGQEGEDVVSIIPAATPFRLSGTAADVDGDVLSYQWDEMDAGGVDGATDASTIGTDLPDASNPLFRSFLPKRTPVRYFPRLSQLLTQQSDIGETLPQSSRTINFRLTVRDGESGVANDDIAIQVDGNQGPFRITGGELNRSSTFMGGFTHTLEWATAGTEAGCANVHVSLLSLSPSATPETFCDMHDSGYEQLSLGEFPNTGSANIELPNINVGYARVMLSCSDNVFFAVSDHTLSIAGSGVDLGHECQPLDGEDLEHGVVFNDADGASKFDSPGGGGRLDWFFLALLLGLILQFALQGQRQDQN
ncbi:MAG: reprolysin-like metallopeptidase [Candidatus Thiodiazotropha sp.]